jgi:hypothetical protein
MLHRYRDWEVQDQDTGIFCIWWGLLSASKMAPCYYIVQKRGMFYFHIGTDKGKKMEASPLNFFYKDTTTFYGDSHLMT